MKSQANVKKLSLPLASQLQNVLSIPSKHGMYQALHPTVSLLLGIENPVVGKKEVERWDYMLANSTLSDKSVVDIGANTGFFSFSAVEAGARAVTAIEGNREHADFIFHCVNALNLGEQINVAQRYFDFHGDTEDFFELAICLNVLHHVGDDFGDDRLSIEQAKKYVSKSIRKLAEMCHFTWLQIGFNWKGNPSTPLFESGMKEEVVRFVEESCGDALTVEKVAIFNPCSGVYEDKNIENIQRFDECGEFLNRPLFLLKSNIYSGC
ncbi:class I SAM-dependent methyltransferase [Marinobacter nauticus]|uniref:Methyltransferase domain-containing protein n=1 Tax=Marinobacter nauticus TaxID=2743 RepID=A0A368UZT7_MARNT|nr:class I SAM-dependent methyltransferase [Marinobacter nauticus]RBP72688.1 hypothetical protein DET64_107286 [Marinobacter nauticus]RCW33615.1 hypothetical protein DET51_107286 [Marinobacter nauticus]